jgi:ribosomal protein L2
LPREPKEEMLKEIDGLDLDDEKKEKLKKFAVEKKIPAEVLVVLGHGDSDHLHSHSGKVSSSFQMEQYLIPEGKILDLEIVTNKKSEILKIWGPSAVILGDIVHQGRDGECFVVKFPSGEFKRMES